MVSTGVWNHSKRAAVRTRYKIRSNLIAKDNVIRVNFGRSEEALAA